MNGEVRIFEDAAALHREAASEFARIAKEAIRTHGRFTVALAGGTTPKGLYALLADKYRDQLSWKDVYFFFGDERHVPPDDKDSNFRMANEALLSKLSIAPAQVARIKGEYKDANQSASEYEQTLIKFFRLAPGQFPRFDLVLLGMGNEGHTLSLFPGTKALHEQQRLVVSNWIGKFYTERITITAPIANNAAHVIFGITGKDKALALKGVLEGPDEPEQLPSQIIKPNGTLLWLLDRDAASQLDTAAPANIRTA